MNIIFWNIRGIGNNDSRVAFRDMCRLHTPSLVLLRSHWWRMGNDNVINFPLA